MSDLTKSSKKLVRELYTYTFDELSLTESSIGSTAEMSNLMLRIYDKDVKDVGYIMYGAFIRSLYEDDLLYENNIVALYLNSNKDIISFTYANVTKLANGKSPDNTEISTKATYASGKYQGKDVNVRVKFLKDSKREIIITYKA